jgi:hypothetical protein
VNSTQESTTSSARYSKFLRHHHLPFRKISANTLHAAIARMHKNHKMVNEQLFDSKTPTTGRYIHLMQDEFRTQAYTTLNRYVREKQLIAETDANELAVELEKQIKTVGFKR